MKIGIDATAAVKQLGGVSEYTRQLIRHLAAIDHTNRYRLVTFSLFRSQTTPLPMLPGNFRERAVPLPAKVIDRMWRKSGLPPLELFAGKVDVLLFPNIFTPYVFSPAVVTVHDLSWLRFPKLAPRGESREFRASLMRATRAAKALIVPSQATKRDLEELADVAPAKITVISEGFDETLRKKPAVTALQQFRQRIGIGDAPYFLFMGTIEPRKNLVRLIRSFEQFKEKTKLPHKLILVGRVGWGGEETKNAIAASSAKKDIVPTGSLNDQDRRLAYWGADSIVFPSLYEGFGLPIIEGQAAERPVLAGTGGSLAEVGRDSVLVVDAADEGAIARGLEQLATDRELRASLVKQGLVNIKRFSWKRCARETLTLLDMVGK